MEEVKSVKLEIKALQLKYEKLLARNTENINMLKDSNLLNIDLQKEVITVIQEMKGVYISIFNV